MKNNDRTRWWRGRWTWSTSPWIHQEYTFRHRSACRTPAESGQEYLTNQFSSIQSLSHVRLPATPWTAARQDSLSITNSRSLLKLMSIESVMPSNHLILCLPFSSCPNPSQHQGIFKWVSSSHQMAKVLEFQLQHQSFQWTPRTDFL